MTHTLDLYGGTTQLKGKSTGWFHLEELDGRRWFITPEGNAFFPVSLSHIYTGNSQPTVQKLYDGDKDAWIEKWFDQMRALGFNCALAGATSQCRDPRGYVDVEKVVALFRRESFPYAAGLFLIPHPNELPEGQERPDIFAPAYQEWVEELVADVCSRYADDPLMKMSGMMEGLYDWDGNPKPGLVDAVREANKEIYERATDPYGSSEIVELDENLCRVRDEVHKHIR